MNRRSIIGALAALFGGSAFAQKAKRECWPPSGTQADGVSWHSGPNINGTQYICTAEGKLVIDKDAMDRKRKESKARGELYWAMRSRVLTDEEFQRVKQYDYGLLVEEMVPYDPEALRREFNDALAQQFRLRMIADGACNAK